MPLDPILALAECARELALFAAAGFLVGGLDDLVIDLIWLARRQWRRIAIYSRHARANAASLVAPVHPGRLAIFVAAWQEATVIGAMIETALARLHHPDWRLWMAPALQV